MHGSKMGAKKRIYLIFLGTNCPNSILIFLILISEVNYSNYDNFFLVFLKEMRRN